MECLWWVDREEERKRFSKKKKRRRKRGGDRDKDGVKKGLFRGKRRVLMECLWWVDREEEGKIFSKKKKKKKKEDWEEREAEIEIRIVWRRRRRGYSEKREGLGGGRWEIIKKVRENIILIKSVYNR